MLIWIAIFVFMLFRWKWLEPVLGTVKMHLFDALMWTAWAAYVFATPAPIFWLNAIFGMLYILFAVSSGRKYLKLDEIVRKRNEQGKSNTTPTAGS